jgi:predicted transcriptional regulator
MSSSFPLRRRGVLAITISILRAAREGIMKTHLLYSVGLSYDQMNRYLGFLKAEGFIEWSDNLYRTTRKGLHLIAEFDSSPLTQSVVAI